VFRFRFGGERVLSSLEILKTGEGIDFKLSGKPISIYKSIQTQIFNFQHTTQSALLIRGGAIECHLSLYFCEDRKAVDSFFKNLNTVYPEYGGPSPVKIRIGEFVREGHIKSWRQRRTDFDHAGNSGTIYMEILFLLFPLPEKAKDSQAEQAEQSGQSSDSNDQHPVKVKLVDQDKNPVPNQYCQVTFPCGTKKAVRTDELGQAEVWGPSSGQCKVEFLDLDESLFASGGRAPASQNQGDSYKVAQGDSLSKIAKRYNTTWKKIWNDPKNKRIKEKRKNPDVIYPGDEFYIPGFSAKELQGQTNGESEFSIKREKEKVSFAIFEGDNPKKNQKYKVILDNGDEFSGVIGDDGKIDIEVPQGVEKASLYIEDEESSKEEYEILIGELDPLDENNGKKQRLENLGYDLEKIEDEEIDTFLNIFKLDNEFEEVSQQELEAKIKGSHGL
jgi:LysM repeat protein